MSKKLKSFTPEQILLLKNSAKELLLSLKNSNKAVAKSFLDGELGEILDEVINDNDLIPFQDIPYFELMTRDYFPEIEREYFNFYSMACFGEMAYKDK